MIEIIKFILIVVTMQAVQVLSFSNQAIKRAFSYQAIKRVADGWTFDFTRRVHSKCNESRKSKSSLLQLKSESKATCSMNMIRIVSIFIS